MSGPVEREHPSGLDEAQSAPSAPFSLPRARVRLRLASSRTCGRPPAGGSRKPASSAASARRPEPHLYRVRRRSLSIRAGLEAAGGARFGLGLLHLALPKLLGPVEGLRRPAGRATRRRPPVAARRSRAERRTRSAALRPSRPRTGFSGRAGGHPARLPRAGSRRTRRRRPGTRRRVRADGLAQAPATWPPDGVPREMTQRVVRRLEVVDVQDDERDAALVAVGAGRIHARGFPGSSGGCGRR